VTDGSPWRREVSQVREVWWSDALSDPWRNPQAQAVVYTPTPASAVPTVQLERPPSPPRRGLGLILLVSIITALLAGSLGGTLGYVFALRGPGGGPLGSGSTRLGNADPGLAGRPPDSLAGVVKKVLPSVVTIKARVGSSGGLGSGFIVSPDGYLITNDHVAGSANATLSVTYLDGRTVAAKFVGSDPESDVAVIKVEDTNLPAIEFGDSDAAQVGDPVLAIGAPLALTSTVTYGIVSAVDRPVVAGEASSPRYYAAIQTDAAINQGNSGGPLFDLAGRVIGINSVLRSRSSDEETAGNIGLNFAIPINQAKRQAQDIIERGKARRTVLGATPDSAYRSPLGGARLSSVESGGPAEAAGLHAGDVVTKFGGVIIEDETDLVALVRKYAPGTVVPIEYSRDGTAQKTSVTLAADAK
jgi:putative serine protease PepD